MLDSEERHFLIKSSGRPDKTDSIAVVLEGLMSENNITTKISVDGQKRCQSDIVSE